MGALRKVGDGPEARNGTTSTSIGERRAQRHGSEQRGWARSGWDYGSKEREARMGMHDEEMATAANAKCGGRTGRTRP